MAQTCATCGGDVFLGEARCPACKAPIPGAAEAAQQAGVPVQGGTGTGPLPPGELSVLVQHGMSRQSIGRVGDAHLRVDTHGIGRRSRGEQYDAMARRLRPTRDREGKVVWSWGGALWGLVVAVVIVAAFTAYVIARHNVTQDMIRRTTSTTVHR